jgi:hypothetical protein
VLNRFADLLARLIDARFETRRAFIRAVYPAFSNDSAKENTAQGYLAKVIGGDPPLMDRVSLYAEALGLTGNERQRFVDLAAISHLPAEVQERFVGYLSTLQKADADTQDLMARVDALERQAKRVAEND